MEDTSMSKGENEKGEEQKEEKNEDMEEAKKENKIDPTFYQGLLEPSVLDTNPQEDQLRSDTVAEI